MVLKYRILVAKDTQLEIDKILFENITYVSGVTMGRRTGRRKRFLPRVTRGNWKSGTQKVLKELTKKKNIMPKKKEKKLNIGKFKECLQLIRYKVVPPFSAPGVTPFVVVMPLDKLLWIRNEIHKNSEIKLLKPYKLKVLMLVELLSTYKFSYSFVIPFNWNVLQWSRRI